MHEESISATEVGERLRIARETAGLTQALAASKMEIARTTLVAIEQGNRRVRIDELQKLALIYGTNANTLLRREAVHVDLLPRFRRLSGSTEDAVQAAINLLANLVKAEVELENILGIRRSINYPPERPILPGNAANQAEQDALELRQRLGIGAQPILDIVTLLEMEIGIRVYVRDLDSRISGLFAYDEQVGACILLNAKHPLERRNQTAAHELGHFISTRRDSDVLHDSSPEKLPAEVYANSFGRGFLTPPRTVIQKLKEIAAGASHLTRRHVILLAHSFGVSREAMVRRLEELGQTKEGTWEWFQENGGITQDQVSQVLGDLSRIRDREIINGAPLNLRINLLANEAWRRDLLSEGQLSKLLCIDRPQLRAILTEEDGNEAPVLLR